ncbi:Protein of unknown function [Pyronema omphalodes CBS 100304]|uniref:Uncharacterized protein n=1 Tax=Pyronema omphalodes (strain CBS 100304) TaxID=1076935 RepID=U4LDG4_PYROM|nr:Protein of unknown function [Pyronema omphalodes CBS 100304]
MVQASVVGKVPQVSRYAGRRTVLRSLMRRYSALYSMQHRRVLIHRLLVYMRRYRRQSEAARKAAICKGIQGSTSKARPASVDLPVT